LDLRDGEEAIVKPICYHVSRLTKTADQLQRNGWAKDAVSVIVIEPELEAWLWAISPRVADMLGWQNERGGLRSLLTSRIRCDENSPKPSNPKEAMRQSLRKK
jgi:hypothetical protein